MTELFYVFVFNALAKHWARFNPIAKKNKKTIPVGYIFEFFSTRNVNQLSKLVYVLRLVLLHPLPIGNHRIFLRLFQDNVLSYAVLVFVTPLMLNGNKPPWLSPQWTLQACRVACGRTTLYPRLNEPRHSRAFRDTEVHQRDYAFSRLAPQPFLLFHPNFFSHVLEAVRLDLIIFPGVIMGSPASLFSSGKIYLSDNRLSRFFSYRISLA